MVPNYVFILFTLKELIRNLIKIWLRLWQMEMLKVYEKVTQEYIQPWTWKRKVSSYIHLYLLPRKFQFAASYFVQCCRSTDACKCFADTWFKICISADVCVFRKTVIDFLPPVTDDRKSQMAHIDLHGMREEFSFLQVLDLLQVKRLVSGVVC